MAEHNETKVTAFQELKRKELLTKYFPERAEKEKLKSMEKAESVGVAKAHIAIEQLFTIQNA